MAHVFISYHQRSDLDFVSTVQRVVEKAGFEVWTDDEIQAGQAWQEHIDQAIRDALALVVVLSPDAVRSAYVGYEWAFALGAGVRVVPMLRGLTENDLHVRLRNLDVLDFSKDEARPWSELIEALAAAAEEARASQRSIWKGMSEAVQAAARALDSVHASERDAALDSLEQMNDPASGEVLANALRHPVLDVRRRAAQLLASRGDARGVDTLVDGLRDLDLWEHFDKWRAALTWLGSDALPKLLELCDDPSETVRGAAVQAIAAVDAAAGLERLISSSRDAAAEVRSQSVKALRGVASDPRAAAAILARAEDEDGDVRFFAAAALREVGGEASLATLARLALGDANSNVRNVAIESLGCTHAPRAIPPLVRISSSENDDLRRRCAEALGALALPEAVAALSALARDRTWSVRRRAIEGLNHIPGEAGTRALVDLLEDGEPALRQALLAALADRNDRAALPALLGAFERETADELLTSFAYAFRDLRAEAAVPALIARLGHAEPKVVQAVRDALDRIATPEARAALATTRERSG